MACSTTGLTTARCYLAVSVSVYATSPTGVCGGAGATRADITTIVPLLPANLHCVLITICENNVFGWIISQFICGGCHVSVRDRDYRQQTNGKFFHRIHPLDIDGQPIIQGASLGLRVRANMVVISATPREMVVRSGRPQRTAAALQRIIIACTRRIPQTR